MLSIVVKDLPCYIVFLFSQPTQKFAHLSVASRHDDGCPPAAAGGGGARGGAEARSRGDSRDRCHADV